MFLFLDKPKGISSFKFLWGVKNAHPGEKVGHAGTLDPMATGMMIVAVGRSSTKLISGYVGLDKKYTATIDLSLYTDTWDDEHRDERIYIPHTQDTTQAGFLDEQGMFHIDTTAQAHPDLTKITTIMDGLIGECELPIPAFSAKKVGGKKLYDLAREGTDLHRKGKMKIFSYSILDYTFPLVQIEIHVGSGTYIRSIGRYLGAALGLGGSLIALRRTQIGEYVLGEADL